MANENENILITLCARGGSKGIPGKNIKILGGKPLIAYSIDHAKTLGKELDAVIELSTDSEEIACAAAELGLVTAYRRPAHLATDNAGKVDTLCDLLTYSENVYRKGFLYLIDLDITSPLRSVRDILNALDVLKNNREAVNIFSVSKAHRNPYFNMVEKGQDGFYQLIKKGHFRTRQESPPVYDLNASFYIYRKSFFEKHYKGAITDKSLIYLMDHICFDLDEPIDFEFMNWLLQHKKLDFDFN